MVPAPGTKEAFEKYLALKPDGRDVEAAKAMLVAMGSTVSTNYENPDRKKGGPARTAPKKK